jgi:hypothetical protein
LCLSLVTRSLAIVNAADHPCLQYIEGMPPPFIWYLPLRSSGGCLALE